MNESDQTRTRNVVIKYMNGKNVPAIDKLFTNKFAGTIKLTSAEWAKAKALSAKFDPAKA
jgi:hypothetical protein